MGMAPPPIYDGSEESKEAFRRWVRQQQRESNFQVACLIIGIAGMVFVFGIGLVNHARGDVRHVPIVHDHFDVLETNHYYDHEGKHVFTQVLFLDFDPHTARYNVQAWRMTDPKYKPRRTPNGSEALFHDKGVLRKVTADSCRESHTQYDVELENRTHLPQEQRRGLTNIRKGK